MSIVSGLLGTAMMFGHQPPSADKQREAMLEDQQVTKNIYEQQRSDFAPFLVLGTAAVGDMNSFDPIDDTSVGFSPRNT